MLKNIFPACMILLAKFLPNTISMNYHRAHFYRLAGMNLAEGVSCAGTINVMIEEISQINLGARTFVNQNVQIGAKSNVCLGDDCLIGPGCIIETSSHRLNQERTSFSRPIIIGGCYSHFRSR